MKKRFQSNLLSGGPLKQKKEPERPEPEAPVTLNLSAQKATALPAPVEFKASATETNTPPEECKSQRRPNQRSFYRPTYCGNRTDGDGLHKHDQTGEQLAVPKPNPQAAESVVMPPQSPHAGVVAQLEAWLRTIESRRRDRDATNEPHPKTS